MEISVIASGSNGNSCLVEDKGTSVLLDAGKSGIEIESRMNKLGKSLENVDGIVITHSHHDHISGAGVLARRFNIPLWMSKPTYEEASFKIGKAKIRLFDKNFRIKKLEIQSIPTSHSVHSCGFRIKDFGLFTDTGIITKEIEKVMPKLKAVLMESNHDVDMLLNGRYPYFLKQWILSDTGHLNNIDASNLIQNKGKNLSLALLGHLSENNNSADVVKKTFETLVKRKIEYKVCSRYEETGSWII